MTDEAPVSSSAAELAADRKRRRQFLERVASIGATAQAAIPGLYAWAITVAPAAWSRGAPVLAKVAAIAGVVALVTAPLVEGAGPAPSTAEPMPSAPSKLALPQLARRLHGPPLARVWSVWGFVVSSAIVWVLIPSALSSARLDAVRGALGMIGWALFAFASAGPTLRPAESEGRIVASASLKPRSDVPRSDGIYVTVGVVLALAMQAVGWGVALPERAVLVRLVTVVCGIAVLSGTTSIALARHSARVPASRKLRLRRALPWLVLLALCASSGAVVGIAR